jgi:UDP:flavonoid glycosyltransferase YjiC (YdhE family)
MRAVFLPPLHAQLADVQAAVREHGAGVVVTDPLFLGGVAYALLPRERRLPVAVIGLIPLMLDSRDTAPFGLGLQPMPGRIGRARNTLLRVLAHRVLLADVERDVEREFEAAVGTSLGGSVLDLAGSVDLLAQLTVPSFEYPRSDLPPSVRFLGPLRPVEAQDARLPDGWEEELSTRTVVHVTQGTVSNAHLEHLMAPTIRGLADDDVLVVASTGRRDPEALLRAVGTPPRNLRVAEFLPYERLLQHTDVMVTNGGYGGVHAALRHGVPLVVAGRTEEKVEVNARVRWSGAGIDLRRQRPAPGAVASAVRRVLADPRYRSTAQRISAEIRATNGNAELVRLLLELADPSARTPGA